MKKILFIAVLISLFSCKDDEFFNGKLYLIENEPKIDTLYGDRIQLDGLYTGIMSVYDSIIIFSSGKYMDVLKCGGLVFNLKTGKQINTLVKVGNGPGEFPYGCSHISQFQIDTAINMWIYDYLAKKKCFLFNVTENRATDTVVLANLNSERAQPHSLFFILDDSLLLAYSMAEKLFTDDKVFLPPTWMLYNFKTGEKLKQYDVFNQHRYDNNDEYNLLSDKLIKPDRTKLLLPMTFMRQINIVDIKTSKIKGFRFKDSPDFNEIMTESRHKTYYKRACADDDLIYAAIQDGNSTAIDLLDWDGNYLKRLVIDKQMNEQWSNIALDPVHKYLYILHEGEDDEEVYRYDVKYLYR